jgi:hypothetical protein
LEEISEEILGDLEIQPVKHVSEVIPVMLERLPIPVKDENLDEPAVAVNSIISKRLFVQGNKRALTYTGPDSEDTKQRPNRPPNRNAYPYLKQCIWRLEVNIE